MEILLLKLFIPKYDSPLEQQLPCRCLLLWAPAGHTPREIDPVTSGNFIRVPLQSLEQLPCSHYQEQNVQELAYDNGCDHHGQYAVVITLG